MVNQEEMVLRRIESILAGMEHRLRAFQSSNSENNVQVNVPELRVSVGDVAAFQQGTWDVWVSFKQQIEEPVSENPRGVCALAVKNGVWYPLTIGTQDGLVVHARSEQLRCIAYAETTPNIDKQHLVIWNGGTTHTLRIHRVKVAGAIGMLPTVSPVKLTLGLIDNAPSNMNATVEDPFCEWEGADFSASGIKIYKNLNYPVYLTNMRPLAHAVVPNQWSPEQDWTIVYEAHPFRPITLPSPLSNNPVYRGIVLYQENSINAGGLRIHVDYEVVDGV